jgi:hypothetical protein
MLMCHQQTTGQNHINVAEEYFQNVAKFKYLATMVTNQNCIHEEIKSRQNPGDACYHAVQNLFFFLSEFLKHKL